MSIQSNIVEAIRSKRKLELNYKNEGLRLVLPHAIYISTTGKTLVDAYQTSGYSTHLEKIPDWRQFDVAKISNITVLEETFNIASGYNPSSDRYSNAISKV